MYLCLLGQSLELSFSMVQLWVLVIIRNHVFHKISNVFLLFLVKTSYIFKKISKIFAKWWIYIRKGNIFGRETG